MSSLPDIVVTFRPLGQPVAGMAAATLLLSAMTGISFSPDIIIAIVAPILLCGAMAAFYRFVRPDQRLAIGTEAVALLTATLALGQLASYPLATLGGTFVDPALAAADHALGFDWGTYFGWIAARPAIASPLALAYASFNIQPVLVVLALVITARYDRLGSYIAATIVALTVTMVIFPFAPAISAFAHHGIDDVAASALAPINSDQHVAILHELRDGSLRHITVERFYGLVTIPSFHTIAAILAIWATWPIRIVRVPFVVVNLAMIAATPVHGAHYLIDVISGIALAAGAIFAARHMRTASIPAIRRSMPA